jgi:hypothetical protein
LSDLGNISSIADSIIVENNDVYILGHGDMNKNLYWKNGIITNLTNTFSTQTDIVVSINSMDVNNGDVYFSGVTQNTAVIPNTYDLVYWKNGIKILISSFSVDYVAYSTSIKAVNNNVYITGRKENGGVLTEGYYLNGVFFPSVNTVLWGCNLLNSDIFVFGSGGGNLGYYKNISTNTTTSFQAISPICHMSFDGGSVYCSDAQNIYKDGVLFYTMPTPTVSFSFYNMSGFEVSNNSIYAITNIGSLLNGLVSQNLLINDVPAMQNSADEIFTSLFIVEN